MSLSAYATADVTAWTGSGSYPFGDPVDTYAEWTVSPSQQWSMCVVWMHYREKGTTLNISHYGNYSISNTTAWGEVDVWCDIDEGTAYYEWDSNEGRKGTWFVRVVVELHGNPDDGGAGTSNDFELT